MLALPPCYAQPASMLNCPAGVTTALLKDNCVKTTSTRCGDGGSKGEMCKSLLALANEKDGCVRGLLDEGAKRYGLSDKQACFWSPACGIDPANLNGANCISALPNPKPTSKKSMTNFKTKVVAQSITDFCENDYIFFAIGIARALEINSANVGFLECEDIFSSRRLLSADTAKDVTVVVYQSSDEESAEIREKLQAGDMNTKLQAEVVQVYEQQKLPPPDTSTLVVAEVAIPTPYEPPEYVRSKAVSVLHRYSKQKQTKWGVDPDTKDGKILMLLC